MPVAHDARFATAALLGLLGRLGESGAPLAVVLEHESLPQALRGHRALALPCAAIPAGTPPTFVYKRTEARAVRAHVPGARVVEPREWTDLASPRLVFVDPVYARMAGRARHTVLLDGREAVRLAHAHRATTDLTLLFGVLAGPATTRVTFGYADMAPDALRRNMLAVLERSRALVGRARVRRATLVGPGGVPVEIAGPVARELQAALPSAAPQTPRGRHVDAGPGAPTVRRR